VPEFLVRLLPFFFLLTSFFFLEKFRLPLCMFVLPVTFPPRFFLWLNCQSILPCRNLGHRLCGGARSFWGCVIFSVLPLSAVLDPPPSRCFGSSFIVSDFFADVSLPPPLGEQTPYDLGVPRSKAPFGSEDDPPVTFLKNPFVRTRLTFFYKICSPFLLEMAFLFLFSGLPKTCLRLLVHWRSVLF